MMNDRNLEDAFAPIPDVVLNRIDGALEEVRAMNQKHRRPTMMIVLVALLILAVGGSAAATSSQWGLFDFFTQGNNKGQTLPEASGFLRTDGSLQGGKADAATIVLRESLCDGRYAWMVFDITPSDEHTLFILTEDRINATASEFSPELPSDMTLADWAKENGYYRIMRVFMTTEDWQQEVAWHRETDGSYTVLAMAECAIKGNAVLNLTCSLYPVWDISTNKQTIDQQIPIQVTLEPSIDPLWTAEWTGQASIPDTDIVLEQVTLTSTVIATYIEITYTASEMHWLYPQDETGKRMLYSPGILSKTREGIMTTSHMYQVSKGRYRCTGLYTPMPESPEELLIGGVHRTSNQRLESVAITFPE